MSLLYASGYFLPLLAPTGVYLLPTRSLFQAVVLPSAVVALAGTAGLLMIGALLRASRMPRSSATLLLLLLVPMTMIALKGILDVAGIDWQNRIPRTRELLSTQRAVKLLVGVGVAVGLWWFRGYLAKIGRLVASLGYAYTAFALCRIVFVCNSDPSPGGIFTSPALAAASPEFARPAAAPAATATSGIRSRRVVWVIFDEADFSRIYPATPVPGLDLPNFHKLAGAAVFATQANSPASATLFSLPALLTGSALASPGVSVSASGSLSIDTPNGTRIPFVEANTIFGALAGRGLTASVLGFYHPYCKLFALLRCDNFPWPGTTSVAAAFESNLPGIIAARSGHPDTWSEITERMLRLLPEYLARDDALTFIHLNVPHLPAAYADDRLHLAASPDPLVEYSRNLGVADHILGDIVRDLEGRAARHDLLLIVSSDHWLRNRWYQANQPEVERPVPFMVWKVGDTQGSVISQPVSTVHTETMVLEWLDGKITTESDIAEWWRGQTFDPTFIAPHT